MGTLDIGAILRSADLFARLDDEALGAFAESSRIEAFEAGETLIEQDTQADCVWILTEGEVSLARNGVPKATLGVGDVAGDLSLLSGRAHAVDATAKTDGKRLIIGSDEFRAAIRHRPEVAFQFIRVLVDRIYHLQDAADRYESGAPPQPGRIEPRMR